MYTNHEKSMIDLAIVIGFLISILILCAVTN
jgi:hypothetical protein